MADSHKTRDSIGQEIAELARRRDAMLRNAPKHVFWRRLIAPLILIPTLMGLAVRLAHGRTPLANVLVTLGVCAIAGVACWKLWRPGYDPHDQWAASDRVGYEGDGPRDLQRRIDAMRANLRAGED